MIDLRIGGQFPQQFGAFGGLSWSHAADGGCKAAKFNLDLPVTLVSSLLVRGALVEVMAGPVPAWRGVIDEIDFEDGWAITAKGVAELAYGDGAFQCFDSAGNTSSVPDVAIDQSINGGWPAMRVESFSNVPVAAAAETDGINKLGDLLDMFCESVGHRWGVGADGVVRHKADPTTPLWRVTADAGRMGLAEDDYASVVRVRYLHTSGQFRTATAVDEQARRKFGPRFGAADRTSLGAMSDAQAQAIADGLVKLGSARLAWTSGIEVARSQITTMAGTPAYLPLVKAGDMVRQFGVQDEQGAPQPFVDWVIGETEYEAGSDVISLAPVGLAERTLGDIFAGDPA